MISKPSAITIVVAILARSIRRGTYDSWRVNGQSGESAELLHHRPYRSRQVHAGGPSPRVHQLDQPARHAGPGPRHHGPGARARDHYQAAGGSDDLSGPRWADVRAEPDRYAGTR